MTAGRLITRAQGALVWTASAAFHALPRFRGRARIVRGVNRIVRGSLKVGMVAPIRETRMRLGHRMLLDLRALTEFQAYYTGDYDTERVGALLRLFEPGWVVADVGANVGFYAVPFARRLRDLGGSVLCFEPIEPNARRLDENLRLNGVDGIARVFRIALSSCEGRARLTLREDFVAGSQTGNAAVFIDDGADARFDAVEVPLSTLDATVESLELTRLDLIKVDIEGHEDAFFAGAARSLGRFRPLVLAELNHDYFLRKGIDLDGDVRGRFVALGYRFLEPRRSGWAEIETLARRGGGEDVLLVPSERFDGVTDALETRTSHAEDAT